QRTGGKSDTGELLDVLGERVAMLGPVRQARQDERRGTGITADRAERLGRGGSPRAIARLCHAIHRISAADRSSCEIQPCARLPAPGKAPKTKRSSGRELSKCEAAAGTGPASAAAIQYDRCHPLAPPPASSYRPAVGLAAARQLASAGSDAALQHMLLSVGGTLHRFPIYHQPIGRTATYPAPGPC